MRNTSRIVSGGNSTTWEERKESRDVPTEQKYNEVNNEWRQRGRKLCVWPMRRLITERLTYIVWFHLIPQAPYFYIVPSRRNVKSFQLVCFPCNLPKALKCSCHVGKHHRHYRQINTLPSAISRYLSLLLGHLMAFRKLALKYTSRAFNVEQHGLRNIFILSFRYPLRARQFFLTC